MKEIKFRAWDKEHNYMWIPDDSLESSDNEGYPHIEMSFKDRAKDWRSNFISDNCILMQFTGLKDKNGKEIYEGDIVKYKSRTRYINEWRDEMKIETGVIIWKNYSFKIDMLEYRYEDERYYSINQKDIEVIGNIYENPKLLELKK